MYEGMTYQVILQRMLDRIPNTLDKREGSVVFDALSPAAMELALAYIEFDQILNESFGDTASRSFLIRRCGERGIIPEAASNAILQGEFTPKDVDVTGRRFNLNKLNYIVTEKIEDGKYRVMCETAGEQGNQYLGTILPIDYIEGLESAELTGVLIPGEDAESTESLREKYLSSFSENAFGGNRKDYINKTKSISGVGGVKITRVWNGDIKPADMIPTDAVNQWYTSVIDGLEGEVKTWLSTVFNAAQQRKLTVGGTVLVTITDADDFGKASDALISLVQETLDPTDNTGEGYGLVPIGHVVKVNTVDEVTVNIITNLTFDAGYSWEILQSEIDDVISSYITELRADWENQPYIIVRISQIETRLLQIYGVVDVADTTINGVDGNLQIGAYEIPIFGSITGGDEDE